MSEIAMVLMLGAFGAVIAKVLRQPIVLGYLMAGTVIGALGLETTLVKSWGQMGVTFLLFLVGMELPVAGVRKWGKNLALVYVLEFVGAVGLGSLMGRWFGLDMRSAVFLGFAMAFGSTVVAVKFLSERRDIESMYGRLATGILVIQDLVAMALLMLVTQGGQGNVVAWIVVGSVVLGTGKFGLPRIYKWAGSNLELWFAVSVAWCLFVVSLVTLPGVGFTSELGGFLAGLALARWVRHDPVVTRLRSIRDFFLITFFISIGVGIGEGIMGVNWGLVLVLAILVLVINPLIVTTGLVWQNYSRRVAFLTAITIAQISEFSLILVGIAASDGGVSANIVGTVGAVALVSMFVSSYYFLFRNKLYKCVLWFCENLGVDLVQKQGGEEMPNKRKPEVVLFGYNRMGRVVGPVLSRTGMDLMIVDFDPTLTDVGWIEYGDLGDSEFLESVSWERCRLVISTVVDFEDTVRFLKFMKNISNSSTRIVVSCSNHTEATSLYAMGAHEVIVPHDLGGEHLVGLVNKLYAS